MMDMARKPADPWGEGRGWQEQQDIHCGDRAELIRIAQNGTDS